MEKIKALQPLCHVYIKKASHKIFKVIDAATGKPWANERFSNEVEARQFIQDNNKLGRYPMQEIKG